MKHTQLLPYYLLLTAFSSSAYAVNWINIMGTEKPGTEVTNKTFAWFQPEFQMTDGTKIPAGNWQGQNSFGNTIRPTNRDSSNINIFRARLGTRGRINQYWNYSGLVEFGNGVITRSEDKLAVALDASLTTNYLGPNLRFGQFKNPSSEEAQQAKYDYTNFALPSAMLVLESFFDGSGLPASTTDANYRNGTVDTFRDIGVQLFDSYQRQDWEHTWAMMISNGNGLMRSDNNSDKDINLYWSSEKIFAGKGKQRQGLKLFAWYRNGKRTLTTSDAGDYYRMREGLGMTYKRDKWSSTLEYINADGMISFGTDGGAIPGAVGNDGNIATFNIKPEAKANGWWGDIGYRVNQDFEVRARYDQTYRDTESPTEVRFDNLTLGLNWFYAPKCKMIFNYEVRSFEAPHQSSTHPINIAAKGLDNRISVQLFHFFKL
ncbi:hypothetical protein [Thiomicrorhabdus sp. Milos-T2]|uniref:hypothetical protein n=1 Tax=Thiomicrorhabdus sp. Milos-T2 TaxID=90814 RepID=UPI0004945477|nr:hypothetical protein [Thiomicrorhabdus sp. Milos-T2]